MSRCDRCGCGGGGGATKSLEQQVNKPVLLSNERGKVEAETFVLQIQAINFFWALRVTGMTLQLSQSLSGVMWVSQPASQQSGDTEESEPTDLMFTRVYWVGPDQNGIPEIRGSSAEEATTPRRGGV